MILIVRNVRITAQSMSASGATKMPLKTNVSHSNVHLFRVFLPFPQQSHVPGSAPANGCQCPETCEMFGYNGLHVVYFNCCGSNAPLLFSQKIATCQDSCNSKPPSPQFPAFLNCQVCLPSPEFLAGRRQEHPLPACLLPSPPLRIWDA